MFLAVETDEGVTTMMSGIDIGLWDIKGKVLGAPVYDLLGDPVRNGIPLKLTSLRVPAFNEVLSGPLDIRDGELHLPERPGLSIELDMDRIREMPDPEWKRGK